MHQEVIVLNTLSKAVCDEPKQHMANLSSFLVAKKALNSTVKIRGMMCSFLVAIKALNSTAKIRGMMYLRVC